MKEFNEHNFIQYCITHLQKERKVRWICFSIVLILGLVLLFTFWGKNRGLVIVGMMLSVTGLKFLFDTYRSPPPKYDILVKTLSFQPENIVWVYALKIDNMPFGIKLVSTGRLALKLNDGKELSLSIPEKDVPPSLSILRIMLPHATFGFDDKKRQMYLIDPYLLFNENTKKNDKLSF